jgi:predicted DNA-binding protein (MmcQ/YjbR family)
MKYEWLDDYCRTKKGTEKDYKEEWEATRYMLKGKMFALQGGHKDGKAIITLKLDPSHGQLLRDEYADIIPGYYMNKEHWNSVYLDGKVPADLLREMIDESYELILASLSKKARQDILAKL